MSEPVKVEFGGGVDPSYDSSVDHVKKGLRETAAEYGKATAEIAEHTAKGFAEHAVLEKVLHAVIHRYKEYRVAAEGAAAAGGEVGASNGILSASFAAVRFAASRALAPIAPVAAGAVSALSLVLISTKLVSGGLRLLESASGAAAPGLGKFSFLDDLTSRLRAVTGSAAAARAKLGEISGTFRGTSVNVPDGVDAFRSARTADNGSGELSSSKGLKLLGDVSVASGNGIGQVGGAVGKLYSDLQSGQPIQAAADQLRSMGVISGETRTMLDRLLASGKSGPEVWAALRTSLEGSTGAMQEQQKTLSALQKGLQDAKDKLYTSFAEGSVPFEKDKLTAQTALYNKLQPAAQEAGAVYGGLKSSLSELVKKFLDVIGVKAAQDKALGDTSTVKTLTDAYILLRAAMFAFGVLAIPFLVGAAIAAGTLTLAVVGTAAVFTALAAAAVAAGAAIYIHRLHVAQAVQALLDYAEASSKLVNALEQERHALVTAADKAKYLADAYAALKQAKEDYANAKTPEERHNAEVRVQAIQAEIKTGENIDERTLKPGEARAKVEGEIQAYNDGKLTDEEKAERARLAAIGASRDAEAKRRRLRDLEKQDTPEGRAAITDDTYKAGLSQLVEQARTDSEGADLNEAKKHDESDAAAKKITDAANAKKQSDKDAADKAQKEKEQAEKAEREKTVGTAEADAEAKIAAISSEGIQRTRDEYEINRQLLEVKLRMAEADGDAVKLAKLRADYYRDQQAQAKKEEENTRGTTRSMQALTDQIESRQDAADKRQLEQDAKAGKITDQQRRDGEAAILERQRKRLEADAAVKEQEARDALAKGDKDKAIRLTTEAQQLHAQADAKQGERDSLLNPESEQRNAVADSLRRVGGGGNAYYGGSGKNPLEAKIERQTKAVEDSAATLKRIEERRTGSAFQ